MIRVIKKDGTKEDFNVQKVVVAVNKSAYRALIKFTDEELDYICRFVEEKVQTLGIQDVPIAEMHNVVEGALEKVNPVVAKSYRDYRNYKQDFVQMLDEVYKKSQSIMYIGDKENSNTDSALVSTKRSLIFNELNKELYKKFFLTVEEIQAIRYVATGAEIPVSTSWVHSDYPTMAFADLGEDPVLPDGVDTVIDVILKK